MRILSEKKCFSLRKSVPSVSDKKKVCKNFRETRELITPQSLGQLEAQVIFPYDEESDHSNKAVRKTPEIESGHKVSEEVK